MSYLISVLREAFKKLCNSIYQTKKRFKIYAPVKRIFRPYLHELKAY